MTTIQALMREAEAARVAHGTSYAAIGRALRLGPGQVARIMRGQSPHLAIVRAAQILEAVGLELSARAFPVSAPVRDAGQVALLARFRARISPDLTWTEEVPVVEIPAAGSIDLRAWDAGIDGPACRVRLDAETHLGDLQAVERHVALKQRDGRVECVILLLSDTRHHRELLEVAGDGLRSRFPVPQREALLALRAGRSPRGNALIRL
jgi:hypothetical protein